MDQVHSCCQRLLLACTFVRGCKAAPRTPPVAGRALLAAESLNGKTPAIHLSAQWSCFEPPLNHKPECDSAIYLCQPPCATNRRRPDICRSRAACQSSYKLPRKGHANERQLSGCIGVAMATPLPNSFMSHVDKGWKENVLTSAL